MEKAATVDPADIATFKIGHHRLDLKLSHAVTEGLEEATGRTSREFWTDVQKHTLIYYLKCTRKYRRC